MRLPQTGFILNQALVRRFLLPAAIVASVFAGGCANRPPSPVLYDLGPPQALPPSVRQADLPAIALTDPRSPSWLSSPLIYYRLLYANDRQPRPYAESRWIMPPAQLFRQRLASQIASAGGIVTSARDSGPTLPVLQMELDDFSHVFTSAQTSSARVSIRASVFDGRKLSAQRTFVQARPAPTSDANGGVTALSQASDAAIADMLQWLSTLSKTAQ